MKYAIKLCFLPIATAIALWFLPASADVQNLPNRETPRPVTTDGIPHIQIDVEEAPEIAAALLERVSTIPGIELRRTVVGRAGLSITRGQLKSEVWKGS